jgi:NitT/TauT family transport system permease protein
MNRIDGDPEAPVAAPAGGAGEVAPWVVRAGQVGLGVALLAAWQLASGRLVDPFFVSSPAEVGARLARWATDGTLLVHGSYTLRAMVAGFVIGAASGFVTGFGMCVL